MSVDIWIFAAVMFVACSLVELTIVGHLHQMIQCSVKLKDAIRFKQQTKFLALKSSVSFFLYIKYL